MSSWVGKHGDTVIINATIVLSFAASVVIIDQRMDARDKFLNQPFGAHDRYINQRFDAMDKRITASLTKLPNFADSWSASMSASQGMRAGLTSFWNRFRPPTRPHHENPPQTLPTQTDPARHDVKT